MLQSMPVSPFGHPLPPCEQGLWYPFLQRKVEIAENERIWHLILAFEIQNPTTFNGGTQVIDNMFGFDYE